MPSPSYRKTNLSWHGQIPTHWEAKPLFAVMKERQRKNIGNREGNVLSLSFVISYAFGLLSAWAGVQVVFPTHVGMNRLWLPPRWASPPTVFPIYIHLK